MSDETVYLEADDLTYIAEIARRRQDNKEDGEVASKKWTETMSEYGCHYEGVITEWAAITVLGLPMKAIERVFPRGDGGIDFYWGKHSCDAKKLSWGKGKGEVLILNPPGPTAAITIGCRIVSPTCVQVVGVVGRKKFMKDKRDHDFNHGPRYYIPVAELSPLDALRSLEA